MLTRRLWMLLMLQSVVGAPLQRLQLVERLVLVIQIWGGYD